MPLGDSLSTCTEFGYVEIFKPVRLWSLDGENLTGFVSRARIAFSPLGLAMPKKFHYLTPL